MELARPRPDSTTFSGATEKGLVDNTHRLSPGPHCYADTLRLTKELSFPHTVAEVCDMLKRTILSLLLASFVGTGALAKSPFVECAVRTGQNASVFIRADVTPTINGVAIEEGDEIVVLGQNGACAGKVVWTGETASITIWGDDEMTDSVDGLRVGEALHFVVFDASENMIFGSAPTDVGVAFDTEFPFEHVGEYRADALFNVLYLDIVGDPVDPPTAGVVDSFELGAPYPNPFNPLTTFELEVHEPQDVAIHVYNSIGQQVASLHNGFLPSGLQHRFQFEASGLSSGMYLIRVHAELFSASKSVILLK